MKIAPGLRLNLGSTSASVRVGGKGMGYTVGTSGQRMSAGIRGSGLHYSKQISSEPPATAFAFVFLGAVVGGVVILLWLLMA